MKLLIDGDTPCYAAAAVHEADDVEYAILEASTIINGYLSDTKADDFTIFLTGDSNFRYKVYPEYKAHRLKMPKPRHLQAVKEAVARNWGAVVTDGNEADDELAFAQTEDTCIVSIDKDLDQIPGEHYHPGIKRQQAFIREPKFYTITPEQGLYFFYYQLLIGDSSDNIKGAPDIGPKKADKILFDCKTEWEYYQACLQHFSCEEELLQNARCVKIGQRPGFLWNPPVDRSEEA